MYQKKITGFGWWQSIKAVFKYAAYFIIVVEGVQQIIEKIETKDGVRVD